MSTVTCKDIYWSFIHHRKRDPSCVKKWAVAYPGFKNATEELWTNIFRLSFSITRETKLQSFQYRLIHRTITCRKRLFEMKMADHPRCLYCKDIDDIKHFFLFCPKVQSFWNSFFLWWNNLGDIIIPPEYECLEECMIFGFQPRGEIFEVLNFCILVAKYYIHTKRLLDDNNIVFLTFLCELKFKLTIEHNICKKNNVPQSFEKIVFLYEQL